MKTSLFILLFSFLFSFCAIAQKNCLSESCLRFNTFYRYMGCSEG